MGRKDFGSREAKKPKKNARKISNSQIMPAEASPEAEVVRKKRKEKEE